MKSVKNYYSFIVILGLFTTGFLQVALGQITLSVKDQRTVSDFELKAKNYTKLREQLESQLPKLPKDASAEQIDAHETALQKAVQNARRNAKQGEVFTSPAARLIRKIIRTNYKGKDLLELREIVFEAQTDGVPLKVNTTYPETKEMVEMPPTLLLRLPQLPKQLRYRFVGRNLLIVDRENGIIVDYMTKALP
jgi:hypothetical protein